MARMKFLCDADRCIECNACVTACKNENQVPWGINRRRLGKLCAMWPRYSRYSLEQIYKMDFDAVRLEPRSFVFQVSRCPDGSRPSVQPNRTGPEGAKCFDDFLCAQGSVDWGQLRPTLSPATQRKRNDQRCESMSVTVASPRNHLYRTPIGTNFPAFPPTGKPDHVGDLPHEFGRKAVHSGTDGDTLDKTAQDLDRLRSGLRIRKSLLETTDFLSIDFRQVGMKSRSRRCSTW